jgi:alpha-tubulin suppressor-like RCC1 family protein
LELNTTAPRMVNSAIQFAQVSAGRTHTCAVSVTGAGFCWGGDEFGELGIGAPNKAGLVGALSPLAISLLPPVTELSAGTNVTCAIATNRNALCWGRGEFAQLATGKLTDDYYPQPVYLQPGQRHLTELLMFSSLAATGRTHACGIADGSVFCWGTGSFGQLGRSESRLALLPQRVSDD